MFCPSPVFQLDFGLMIRAPGVSLRVTTPADIEIESDKLQIGYDGPALERGRIPMLALGTDYGDRRNSSEGSRTSSMARISP